MQVEILPQLACLCASLNRATRSVTHLYERALETSVPRFTLLYLLGQQSMVQAQIAELLTIDRTTLTRTLASLERQGLIRAAPGKDKRERRWSLTSDGRKALARILPKWEKAQARFRKRLGAERWEVLIAELTNVAAAARMRATDGVDRFRPRKTAPPRL
ncbi:MAG TPA: MarR family transcriptional regulator [Gemmatimonadales bacterium]|nr:MarR family transcriptional regulator [Gemmatimonadales bacterium]